MSRDVQRWYDGGMIGRILLLILVVVATLQADDSASPAQQISQFVEAHCLDCHNDSDASGELSLDSFDASITSSKTPWDTIGLGAYAKAAARSANAA